MLMLTRRLQILIDERRLQRLEREAARRGVPISVVVRDAIDAAHPSDEPTRTAAARRILSAEPMPVPDPAELRAELDKIRASGQ